MTTPSITLTRTRYLVPLNGTIHHIRRDRICDCGGTPANPCPAIPLVQDYLAGGGPRPLGRHPDTWPASWVRVPPSCPICDCPTVADRYLNSRAGPGWLCSLTSTKHFWLVRMEPLRRYLAAHPPSSRYPWYDTPEEERRAWLEAHYHPPRLAPTIEDKHHAPDRRETSQDAAGDLFTRAPSLFTSTLVLFTASPLVFTTCTPAVNQDSGPGPSILIAPL